MDPVLQGRWIVSGWKHLRLFQPGEYLAHFYATQLAGRAADFLGRIRLLERIEGTAQIEAIGKLCGIAPQELRATILPLLESRHVVIVEWGPSHEPLALNEFSTTEDDVALHTVQLWHDLEPNSIERAAVLSLELASSMPVTEVELLDRLRNECASDSEAQQVLQLAESFSLVQQRYLADFGTTIYFNEYLWGRNIEGIGRSIASLPADLKGDLRGLIDEVQLNQGLPVTALEVGYALKRIKTPALR